MKIEDHLSFFEEGIKRATLIKRDLQKHPTEYFPQKVRLLNKIYIETVKQIIYHGEEYLKKTKTCTDEDIRIAITVDNYRSMLISLPKRNEDDD